MGILKKFLRSQCNFMTTFFFLLISKDTFTKSLPRFTSFFFASAYFFSSSLSLSAHHFICSMKATVFIFFFFTVYMSPHARNSFCRTQNLGYCYFSLLVNQIYTCFFFHDGWVNEKMR